MLDRQLLDRLGQLNRQPLPAGAAPSSHPSPLEPISTTSSISPASPVSLQGVIQETCWGEHWLIEEPMIKLSASYERELQGALRHLPGRDLSKDDSQDAFEEAHPEVRHFAAAFPEETIYLDLETCGLAGAMVFLAGILHWQADRGFVLTQLLARTYSEEKAILQSLWDLAADKRVLISFNGKSFDWPMVHDRSTLHHLGRDPRLFPAELPRSPANTASARMASSHPSTAHRDQHLADIPPFVGLTRDAPQPDLIHFDLLHHSRRRWRTRLPNCRLQTLEHYICGRRRLGDIPGKDIPDAYHQFVRTGDSRQMRSILHHNALDLITLWQLSIRIPLANS